MNAVKAELRKTFTTRMWWALIIPVVLVSMVVNAFGGLFETVLPAEAAPQLPSLLPLSLAWTLTQVSVLAAVAGTIAAAGEFRHRTITTTYLTSSGRGAVLVAKLVVNAMLGALYGLAAALTGALVGLLAQSAKPGVGQLLGVIALGTAVCALWAVLGAALGMPLGNQVGALVLVLVYLLLAEPAATVLLGTSDDESVAQIAGYLPGNASDVAVLAVPATSLVPDAELGDQLLAAIATVTNPPAWGIALLVLALWTALVVALGAVLSSRRDIT